MNGMDGPLDLGGGGGGTPTSNPVTSQVEQTLEDLLQSLLEMGICASDVQESALESSGGVAAGFPGGLIGKKVVLTVDHLSKLYDLRDSVSDILIPLDVINAVDSGKNPHQYTHDFVERVALENMYTNGILAGLKDYSEQLKTEMSEAFPDWRLGKSNGGGGGGGSGEGDLQGMNVD